MFRRRIYMGQWPWPSLVRVHICIFCNFSTLRWCRCQNQCRLISNCTLRNVGGIWMKIQTFSKSENIFVNIVCKIPALCSGLNVFCVPSRLAVGGDANDAEDNRSNQPQLQEPLYWHSLTLLPAWINNYLRSKVCDEITYPFPNFNGATVEVWKWISNFIPCFIIDVITYPCRD